MGEHRLRILHISDLHERVALEHHPDERKAKVRDGRARRYRVLGGNFHEILSEAAKEHPFDLVCFTGDVADRGLAEEYAAATARIDDILQAIGVGRDRLFVVPGNHDVNRQVQADAWGKVRELGRRRPEDLGPWLAGADTPFGAEGTWREAVLERGSAFQSWVTEELGRPALSPGSSPHGRLGWRVRCEDLPFPVHIIGLDSAWLSGDDNDQGKLLLTDEQLSVLANGTDGKPLPGLRLALVHHPLSHLAHEQRCWRLLADRVDLLLHGHQHEPLARVDTDRQLHVLAAGSLFEGDEGDRWVNSFHVIDAYVDDGGRPERYDVTFYAWSSRGHWHVSPAMYREAPDGRLTIWLPGHGPGPEQPPPSRKERFVAREGELAALEAALVGGGGAAVCKVNGMAGIGKTWLVEEFYARHSDLFPGGYIHEALERGRTVTTDGILSRLADAATKRLGTVVPANNPGPFLALAKVLVFVDNIDNEDSARAVAACRTALTGVPLVVCGRYTGFGGHDGWQVVQVPPFNATEALQQLDGELGDQAGQVPAGGKETIVRALGGHPLAISLAGGYLRAGYTAGGFLDSLRAAGLNLQPIDVDQADYVERTTQAPGAAFDLAMSALERKLKERSAELIPALAWLAEAPRGGFGPSLGAAIAGTDEGSLRYLLAQATLLSLASRVPAPQREDVAWRIHPLVGEYLRAKLGEEELQAARERMHLWFLPRVADGEHEDRAARWDQAERERAGLLMWLAGLAPIPAVLALNEGFEFACARGPYRAWVAAAQRALRGRLPYQVRSRMLWVLGNLQFLAGEHEAALRTIDCDRELARRAGDDRSRAMAGGLRATVLQTCGQLRQALQVLGREVLPLLRGLNDEREQAVELAQMADILVGLGRAGPGLELLQRRVLPVLCRLGERDACARALGVAARALAQKGMAEQAACVLRNDVLPVLREARDANGCAVLLGEVALLMSRQGDTREALRLLHAEVLPVLAALQAQRPLLVSLTSLATILYERGERHGALALLENYVLPALVGPGYARDRAAAMGLKAAVLCDSGEIDAAVDIHRDEEIPVYVDLGDARSLVVARTNLAQVLWLRGLPADKAEARALLHLALDEAKRLSLAVESSDIEEILADIVE